MTKIDVLSHACMVVSTDQAKVIVDPWLTGSCYWRSWWNYPEPEIDADVLESVDAVFLSHIHWDHWHGPTLKRFFKNTSVYIGDDPNPRSMRDLKSIGFDDIHVVRHGASVNVNDITVSFYNFGLLLNDSALVIETADTKILNANDAKIAGASLKKIVRIHGGFDFAFRSHSSANSRVCYEVIEGESSPIDDRDHYFRSFALFMDAVNPKYAVPFASNHCHLLQDAFHFNQYVSKPNELKSFIGENVSSQWMFVMLLPGSSWSTLEGFELRNQDAFEGYEEKLIEYQQRKMQRLEFYREREERVAIAEPLVHRFRQMLLKCGSLGSLSSVRFVLTKPSGDTTVLLWQGEVVTQIDESDIGCHSGRAVVNMPAVVFRDAVVKNMFHHAGISKRCTYQVMNDRDLASLQRFIGKLEQQELIGDASQFWPRWAYRQVRRWSDFFVYFYAVYYRFMKRLPYYLVEEAILRRHSGARSGRG